MSMSTIRFTIGALAGACLFLTAPAAAQMAPAADQSGAAQPNSPTFDEARALLVRVADHVRDLDSLSARAELTGGGSQTFLQFMPSGTATFRARRNTGDDSAENPWTQRIFGEGKERGDKEDTSTFDFAWDAEDVTWVEDAAKRVVTAPIARARVVGATFRDQLNLDELLGVEPLARELTGVDFALEGKKDVGGVECDVVLVTYPEQEVNRRQRKALPNKSRWYIGGDLVPRRVERMTEASVYSLSLDLTLNDLEINPALSDEDMRVDVPAGYEEVDQRSTAPRIGSVQATKVQRGPNAGIGRPGAAEEDPAANRTPAPAFELKTRTGETVTLDGQAGKVTVLYFWGPWCLPCREFSPLVSGLVDTFEGQAVSVLAPAFMSDPGAAADTVSRGGYRYTLLVNADEAKTAYRVRVAPTIVVIDAEGREIFRETNSKQETPAEIVTRVERTVREELARIGG